MGTHKQGMVVGTGPKAIQVSENVARMLELRKEGMTLQAAADLCGIPYVTAREWIKKYIRHVSSKAVIAFRNQELETLEKAQERVLEALFATNYMFYQGVMCTTPHPSGVMEVDPVTGRLEPVRVPVIDHEPNIRAATALMKVMERKSRLLGADKPPEKVAGPEGEAGADGGDPARSTQMTPAVMAELFRRLAMKAGVRLEATDVTPRVVPVEHSTTVPLDPLVDEAQS